MEEPYDGYYTRTELEAMKAEAARIERERCARVCDDLADKRGGMAADALRFTAAAIRKGE